MTFGTLIRRSLRHHFRSHLGVIAGTAIGSAALTGALVVGDSVRFSLREMAVSRLGNTWFAMSTGDRLFPTKMGMNIPSAPGWAHGGYVQTLPRRTGYAAMGNAVALTLPGTAALPDGSARINRLNVFGVDPGSWPRFAGWEGLPGVTTPEFVRLQLGMSSEFFQAWKAGEVVFLNAAAARVLGVREQDEVILRVAKPSAIGVDSVLSPTDDTSFALRMRVGMILPETTLANFDLGANPPGQANAFLPLEVLSGRAGVPGRANLLLTGPIAGPSEPPGWLRLKWMSLERGLRGIFFPPGSRRFLPGPAPVPVATPEALAWLQERLQDTWKLEDAGYSVSIIEPPATATGGEYITPQIEIKTSRLFLEPSILEAALQPRTTVLTNHRDFALDQPLTPDETRFITKGLPVFTYLATLIRAGARATPYSMVTAAEPPYVPADLAEDEIVVNDWLARDLQVSPGDPVDLSYFVPDSAGQLVEKTNRFRVHSVVPLRGIHAERSLMPDFPGLAKAERTHDWNAGFPLTHTIRDEDEAYWKEWRGTPKAFIKFSTGQKLWSSRYGALTAVRYPVPDNSFAAPWREVVYRNLLANLDPQALGLRFDPVRDRALAGASQAQDFGQLFLGFSFFLVTAALLLMALLLRFALEQRRSETGTFLALGFTPTRVRRLLLLEASALSLLGGVLGGLGGVFYAQAMLWGLATIWNNAIAGAPLQFHVTGITLLAGMVAGTITGMAASWLALRKEAQWPVVQLLTGTVPAQSGRSRGLGRWVAAGAFLGAAAIVGWALAKGETTNAGAFFGAGVLVLTGGLALASLALRRFGHAAGARALTLFSLGLRSCGRRPDRSLATLALLACGAFVIVSIGVFRLDVTRDALVRTAGTGGFRFIGATALPVVQDLNHAAGREAFGLDAEDLADVQFLQFRVREGDDASCLNLNRAQRPRVLGVNPDGLAGRFTFVKTDSALQGSAGWDLLRQPLPPGEIAAIGDASSVQWSLGKKVGDTVDYTDERGRSLRLRLVGTIANSILQGSLVIDEQAFVRAFPSKGGYRWFLLDAPADRASDLVPTLTRALQDAGLELTAATDRLNAFNEVQNTYLGTFQVLGGLGLLLGSAGLGIVVLRNVLERRGEMGLLTAVGFTPRKLRRMILVEHAALLGAGLGLGIVAAFTAVVPSLLTPGQQLPWLSLAVTLGVVLLNGLAWTYAAAWWSARGNLLSALRNE